MKNTLANIFTGDAFSAVSLTKAINLVPTQYGRITNSGLFKTAPVRTNMVGMYIERGVIKLIKSGVRGAPVPQNAHTKGKLQPLSIPHFPLGDQLLAPSLAGVLNASEGGGFKEAQSELNKLLIALRANHDITKEFHKTGALQGVVYDADGTILINFFEFFGVDRKEVDFKLGTSGTDIGGLCTQVTDHIEDNLLGDTMTGVKALCGRTFFNKFTSHKTVKEAYLYHTKLNPNRDDVSGGFIFKGIDFSVYRAKAHFDLTDSAKDFIPDGGVAFYPDGTLDTFTELQAPAQTLTHMNTLGKPFYASMEIMDHDAGIDIQTESNVLPMCRRPGVLVSGISSD